jgi:hypothetical protein
MPAQVSAASVRAVRRKEVFGVVMVVLAKPGPGLREVCRKGGTPSRRRRRQMRSRETGPSAIRAHHLRDAPGVFSETRVGPGKLEVRTSSVTGSASRRCVEAARSVCESACVGARAAGAEALRGMEPMHFFVSVIGCSLDGACSWVRVAQSLRHRRHKPIVCSEYSA